MSLYLPSFLTRAAAPSETTPLVDSEQDDTAAEEGNTREEKEEAPPEKGDVEAFVEFVQTRQGFARCPIYALMFCLYSPILLAAAFVIWTIITLLTTFHVLLSQCAEASPIWVYLISVLAFLVLETISSLCWHFYMCCFGFLHAALATQEDCDKNEAWQRRSNAQVRTLDALVHVLLSIWGVVIWTNLRCSLCCLVEFLQS